VTGVRVEPRRESVPLRVVRSRAVQSPCVLTGIETHRRSDTSFKPGAIPACCKWPPTEVRRGRHPRSRGCRPLCLSSTTRADRPPRVGRRRRPPPAGPPAAGLPPEVRSTHVPEVTAEQAGKAATIRTARHIPGDRGRGGHRQPRRADPAVIDHPPSRRRTHRDRDRPGTSRGHVVGDPRGRPGGLRAGCTEESATPRDKS
jgi:hypothetical protein